MRPAGVPRHLRGPRGSTISRRMATLGAVAVRKLLVADLFCGAGGTTTGTMQAIEALGREVEFVAVNHWPVAVATHARNHPTVRHFCKDLDAANPREIVPEGELDLLLASPSCQFHSPAQGGRPLDEQNRASAWHVVRWAECLYVRRIVVENVPRFLAWGPLDRNGRPIKKREGEMFRAWVNALIAIGYKVEWRVLNAADYGTPQTRKRLMVQARRDGRRIVWPEQTHAPRGSESTLYGGLESWTPARRAIRFDKYRHLARPVEEKDLAPKTLERIAEGVKRFCRVPEAEPFLVTLRQSTLARSVDDPLTAITTSGRHHLLIEPFVIPQGGGGVARSTEDPLPTIATGGAIGVVEPFVCANRTNNVPRSIDEPMAAITTSPGGGMMVVEPFLLLKRQHDEVRSLEEPLPTITASGTNHFVIEPYLVESNHGKRRAPRSVEYPLPTITQKNGVGLVEPMVRGPRLVLLHRMLQPDELACGQDFDGYEFTGNREQQTKQIGNAVPIKLARAMASASLWDVKPAARTSRSA